MKTDKWIALTTSRNDGDFLETFVRGNAPWIGKFVLLDASTDNSRAIARRLAAEGFDIDLWPREDIGNPTQVEALNWALARYAKEDAGACYVPLDVDEIILPRGGDDTANTRRIAEAPPGVVFNMPWVNFLPVERNGERAEGPLASAFFSASAGNETVMHKVLIPRASASGVWLEPGNHGVRPTRRGVRVRIRSSELDLAHFPVRGADQLVLKVVIALATIRRKPNRLPGEATHLVPIANALSASRFQPSLEDLWFISLYYSGVQASSGTGPLPFVRRRALRVLARLDRRLKRAPGTLITPRPDQLTFTRTGKEQLLPDAQIRWPELARVNLNLELFRLLEDLVSESVACSEGQDDAIYRILS